jgi:hypothetical protein
VIASATCSRVVGDFVASIAEQYSGAGVANPYTTGSFVANRIGNLTGEDLVDYNNDVAEIMQDAEDLRDATLKTGEIDWVGLQLLMSKAEIIAGALEKGERCGISKAHEFLGVLADVIADIYRWVLDNPGTINTVDLGRLTYMGVRMGVTGSGAPNQQQAAELESAMVAELSQRLEVAIANNYEGEIIDVYIAQGPLGDSDLKARATEAFNEVMGGN